MLDRILLSIKYCPYILLSLYWCFVLHSFVQTRSLIVVSELSILLFFFSMRTLLQLDVRAQRPLYNLEKVKSGWRGCKIACKCRLFLLHQSGVPHLHVNRPLHSKGVIKDCSNYWAFEYCKSSITSSPPPQTPPSQISLLSLISLSFSGEES